MQSEQFFRHPVTDVPPTADLMALDPGSGSARLIHACSLGAYCLSKPCNKMALISQMHRNDRESVHGRPSSPLGYDWLCAPETVNLSLLLCLYVLFALFLPCPPGDHALTPNPKFHLVPPRTLNQHLVTANLQEPSYNLVGPSR